MTKERKKLVIQVKRRLWANGHRVTDYSELGIVEFDLIVNKKYKVIVGRRRYNKLPKKCDAYVMVSDNDQTYFKKLGKKVIETKSVSKAFSDCA